MLDLMRKHARSWFIKVALGGITIVFVFWYGWSGPGEKSRDYLAKVNGTIISTDQFRQILDTERAMRQRFQKQAPPEAEENLKKDVAQRLVNQTLLVQEAKRLGLFVTDQDLVNDIRRNRDFQRDGVFDDNLYRMHLSENLKMTPTTYEQIRRNELLGMQVVNLLIASVKTIPDEIKTFWHFQGDKLFLSILLVKADAQKESVTPDPAQLEAYFKEHKARYEIPPMVTVQYVAFSWRDAEKQLSVSDEEARTYYANHPKDYLIPESIHVRQILIRVAPDADKETAEAALKKAEEIRDRINAGEDFAAAAKKDSQDEATADKGGDLGFFSRNTMDPRLDKAAEKLEPGKVSDPVRTGQGYHLLSVVERKPESQREFDLVKQDVIQKLLQEKAKKKISADADEFYEKVYRTENLEGPAKEFGFQVQQAGPISKVGGIPDVGQDSKIMDEAFQLRVGEISRMLRNGDKYVVMKLLEKHKERVPALDEIRSTVEQDYMKHQTILAAEKKASEVIEALKQPSADPLEVAKKFGLAWEDLSPVSRTANFIEKLGSGTQVSDMLTTLSTTAPLLPTPIIVPDGAAVVRLAKLEPASEEQYAKEAPVIERWVLEVRQTEFLKGWLKLMTEKSKIEMNEKLL